jgi:hypothetical protein
VSVVMKQCLCATPLHCGTGIGPNARTLAAALVVITLTGLPTPMTRDANGSTDVPPPCLLCASSNACCSLAHILIARDRAWMLL